jgi:hypothetical protein
MQKCDTRLFFKKKNNKKNKAGSNEVTTHSDTKRNIPRGPPFCHYSFV